MIENQILLIDDDHTIIELVERTLEKNNYKCLSALNGHDGLQILKENTVDAIILDINMPEISGNEILEKIRNLPETSKIPVLMLTGENNVKTVSNSLKLGANDYMVKPFDKNILISRLNELTRKQLPD